VLLGKELPREFEVVVWGYVLLKAEEVVGTVGVGLVGGGGVGTAMKDGLLLAPTAELPRAELFRAEPVRAELLGTWLLPPACCPSPWPRLPGCPRGGAV
jgi:hypothetical protein